MADALQSLIGRIKEEGIGKADEEAEAIVAAAKERAAAIVVEAEADAKARLIAAEKEAEAFAQSGRKTLEQAGRDVILTVGRGIDRVIRELAAESAASVVEPADLPEILLRVVDAYVAAGGAETRIEVLASEADRAALASACEQRLRERFAGGVTIGADSAIGRGFTISFGAGGVRHDFTDEAIADSLCRFLRPQLSEIVHRAARGGNEP